MPGKKFIGIAVALLAVVAVFISIEAKDKSAESQKSPEEKNMNQAKSDPAVKTEFATFGGGCFWGVEENFRTTEGVVNTAVGYMGGDVENPSYKQVCTDTTGHVEVCRVEYDPSKISYGDLVNLFWKIHDPTQVNRQGPDVGFQYRSVIFYENDAQKQIAENSKSTLDQSGKLSRPVATAIVPAGTFWMAEDYHQQYLFKRGLPACGIH